MNYPPACDRSGRFTRSVVWSSAGFYKGPLDQTSGPFCLFRRSAGVPGLNRSRTSRSDPPGLQRAESFWYSRRRGLRPRCGGQYQLSFSPESRWVPAPPVKSALSPGTPAAKDKDVPAGVNERAMGFTRQRAGRRGCAFRWKLRLNGTALEPSCTPRPMAGRGVDPSG